ncbi:MAG: hypothetical protein HIU92_17385 [Proteobacteria bacterium]|nr:hypothetical protein [Pseudomonadota bacterium]
MTHSARANCAGREALRPADAESADREAVIAERVEQEVGRIRARAEADGRARGEAMAQRTAEATAAAAAAETAGISAAVNALDNAWTQLAAPLAQKEQELADLVMELAFELARHIVGLELALRPESVAPLVDGLVEEACRARTVQQSIVIRLNPADHGIVEPRMAIEHAHLLADAQIERGGAVVELIASGGDPIDKIEWDGTLASRLDTVRAALGLPGPASDGAVRRSVA